MVLSYKNLVYSSVGDNNPKISKWLYGNKDFDVLIIYYGKHKNKYLNDSDYYFERSGSKWQNIYFIYQTHQNLLNRYNNILLLDDDIMLNTNQINKLFKIRKKYGLSILAPAFRSTSKISHPITKVNPKYFLRYTKLHQIV